MQKNRKIIILYIVTLILHLIAILFQWNKIVIVTKPILLLLLLTEYYFVHEKQIFNKVIIVALFFSLLGDVLLLFQEQNNLFFKLGLASFLIAQLCYAFYFTKQLKNKQSFSKVLLFAVGAYAIAFYFFLLPKLGGMQMPVLIYALSISCMLIASLQVFIENKNYLFCAIGALLFVASDSILAINKFHTPFESASFIVMLTYGLAQLLLIVGIVKNDIDKSTLH